MEGHYCLLARWVSANDPMTFAEGPSTGTNTRNNNNIAWHNLNILTASSTSPATSTVVFRNIERTQAAFDLAIRPNGAAFPGTVDVTLDDELLAAWRTGGGRGVNVQQISTNTIRVAGEGGELQNLILKPGAAPKATLTFTVAQGVTGGTFTTHLIQFNRASNPRQDVGGVAFQVTVK